MSWRSILILVLFAVCAGVSEKGFPWNIPVIAIGAVALGSRLAIADDEL